jgi:hypothetical protein
MTIMTGITYKGFDSLQRLAIGMYEFKSNIKRKEEVELMCFVFNGRLLGCF